MEYNVTTEAVFEAKPIISIVVPNHDLEINEEYTLMCRTRELYRVPHDNTSPAYKGEEEILQFLQEHVSDIQFDYIKKCFSVYPQHVAKSMDSGFYDIAVSAIEGKGNTIELPMIWTVEERRGYTFSINLAEVSAIRFKRDTQGLDISFSLPSTFIVAELPNRSNSEYAVILHDLFEAWTFWKTLLHTNYSKESA